MKETYSPAILASYATFKELYNEGKYHSPYQILAEFIKYIIATEHDYSFSLFDMKNSLKRVFGFELPTAVIKTAIKGIKGIVKREDSIDYDVDEKQISESLSRRNVLCPYARCPCEYYNQYVELVTIEG